MFALVLVLMSLTSLGSRVHFNQRNVLSLKTRVPFWYSSGRVKKMADDGIEIKITKFDGDNRRRINCTKTSLFTQMSTKSWAEHFLRSQESKGNNF